MTTSAEPGATRAGVLVTGAGGGIGRACVATLVGRGLHVFAGVRSATDSDALAGYEHTTPLPLDVTDRAQVDAAAKVVADQLGPAAFAGVVNNAGSIVTGPLEHMPIDDVRRLLEVNTLGPLHVVQAFAPLLRGAQGRVVMIGSTSAHDTGRFVGAYAASKAALDLLSSALRLELAEAGVQVVVIEPGVVATPHWTAQQVAQAAWTTALTPEGTAYYGARAAARAAKLDELGRTGMPPEVVAEAVADALLSPRPRPRYRLGHRARLLALAQRGLPERAVIRLRV